MSLNLSKEEQFLSLYQDIQGQLYGYALGLVRDAATAEDVVATSFAKLYRRRYLVRHKTLRPLFFKTVKNSALDELRRQKRQAAPTDYLPEASIEDSKESLIEKDWLFQGIYKLKTSERELLALKYWADLSNKEISKFLGITESAVSTRLNRVLSKLREVLEDE
jgi:RNA polymerase sigma-70 factor, ECF subfamily